MFEHFLNHQLLVDTYATDLSALSSAMGSDLHTTCRERVVFEYTGWSNNQLFFCNTIEEFGDIQANFLENVEPLPFMTMH